MSTKKQTVRNVVEFICFLLPFAILFVVVVVSSQVSE